MAEHRWAEKYPFLGTGPVDTSNYWSPEIFAKEEAAIFRKTWLMVGREEEIPSPGDYKVKRIDFAGTSAILMRGKDGVVRAFHNVCSHRGNKVVVEKGNETFGGRRTGLLFCRFHGWVYDSQGELVQVPKEEGFFPCFAREQNGLARIRCEVWEGFIFINLDDEGGQSLVDYLGDFGTIFESYPFDRVTHKFAYFTELNCNWKIAVDAFAEAYHVDTIHGKTFPGARAYFEDIRLLGDHRIAALCAEFSRKPTPVAELSHSFTKASVIDNVDQAGLPEKVNPGRREDFINELGVMFPSLILHVTKGIWFTHQFWPIAHDRTRWEGTYYVVPPQTHSEIWAIEHAQVVQRNAWLEDTATMEATHEALASGAKPVMHLQDDEVLIRHGCHVVDRYLKSAGCERVPSR